ncbi:MAG: TonB-dependent receptor [Kiritimatiellia bacterium]
MKQTKAKANCSESRHGSGRFGFCPVLTALLLSCTAYGSGGDGEDIIITASRVKKDVFDVPAGVQVIDSAAIRRAAPVTLAKLFKNAVGIDLQGGGFPGEEVRLNMRGLTPGYGTKRVLVLIDGRRINEQYQGTAELSLLTADSIERVEIVRGPASAIYGSNAMGGVINIVTRRGKTRPGTEIMVSGGSHNTWHNRISSGYRKEALDCFITVSDVRTDGYTDNSDGTDRDWIAQSIEGNAGWQITDNSEIRLFLGALTAGGTAENFEQDTRKDHEGVLYRWNRGGKRDASFTTRLYRDFRKHEYDWKYPGEGIYDQYTLGGEIQQSLWTGENNFAVVGVDGRSDNVDIEEATGPIDERTSVFGFYCQDELYLADVFRVIAGVRQDYSSDFGSRLSPRVGFFCRPAGAVGIFASANMAHREPALSDRYVKQEYNGMLFEGNPDLEPETLKAYEAGVRYGRQSPVRTEIVGFYNDMRDSFDFLLEDDGVFRIRNVTAAETYGVETRVRWRMSRNMVVSANYTFTDGEYEEFGANPALEGNRLAYLARHKANCSFEYAVLETANAVVQCRYVGNRYGDAQNSAENTMGSYLTVDFHGGFALLGQEVVLGVDNIFDETYEEFPGSERPGRTARAGVNVVF